MYTKKLDFLRETLRLSGPVFAMLRCSHVGTHFEKPGEISRWDRLDDRFRGSAGSLIAFELVLGLRC